MSGILGFVLLGIILLLAYRGLRGKPLSEDQDMFSNKQKHHQTNWPGAEDKVWDDPLSSSKVQEQAERLVAEELSDLSQTKN